MSREAFEKAYHKETGLYASWAPGNKGYTDVIAGMCYRIWQAAQAQASKPIAAVHGWFHGECVIRPLDPEAVLTAGMALYSQPQSIPDCHGIANGKRTEDMGNKELRYHMQELSAMCYRQADEIERLAAEPAGVPELTAVTGPEDIDPFRALLADYELLVRCARRCAYDLHHCVGMIDRERYSALKPMLESKADHWVDLFAKGNPGKDYRHDLLRRLHNAQDALEKIDNYFRSQGKGYPKELESIFDGMFGIPF